MNFTEYQERALETALPTALTPDYLVPMIVGEIGELFGKIAKARRDSWDTARTSLELAKEYGDVCWGVAVLLWAYDAQPPEGTFGAGKRDMPDDIHEALCMLNHTALELYARRTRPENALFTARILWTLLYLFCELVTGHSFDEVLQMNLTKLTSRKERGVIEGSGDNR